jgi:hypothetical protein
MRAVSKYSENELETILNAELLLLLRIELPESKQKGGGRRQQQQQLRFHHC